MEQYLSLGRSFIYTDKFRPIKNHGSKPIGGIWATKQDPEHKHFNLWVDYLSYNPHILFYKHKEKFNIPAIFITLKENSNILVINDIDTLYQVINDYPHYDWIDFEEVAKNYDAIYIAENNLLKQCNDIEIVKHLITYGVSSLIIFNSNCIDYYQKARVIIEPYDYEFENSFSDYTIEINPEKEQVETSEETINKYVFRLHEYIRILDSLDNEDTLYHNIKIRIIEIIDILQNTLKYDNEEISKLKRVFIQS